MKMKPSSGSKKTNPNKANFKHNLAKEGHHEFLFIDKINALGYYIIKICCEKSLFERERLWK
jgi:hypothetical protein